jgi:hypothetical protein
VLTVRGEAERGHRGVARLARGHYLANQLWLLRRSQPTTPAPPARQCAPLDSTTFPAIAAPATATVVTAAAVAATPVAAFTHAFIHPLSQSHQAYAAVGHPHRHEPCAPAKAQYPPPSCVYLRVRGARIVVFCRGTERQSNLWEIIRA